MLSGLYRSAFLLVFLLFGFLGSFSQSWKEFYDQSVKLYDQEQLVEAYDQAELSLQRYINESGAVDENYAAILRHLANVCYGLEKYDQGIEYLLKEIQIRESKPDQGLADARINLAEFFKQQEKYGEAIEQIKVSEKILQGYFQSTDPELISCRLNLATTYYLAGVLPASYEIFQEHFKKLNEITRSENEELRALYYYGLLLNDLGKIEEAVYTFIRARELWEKEGQNNDLEFASVLSGLGQAFHQYNLFFKAEEAYLLAQQLYESLQLINNNYFKLINARAVNLQSLGQTAKAQELFAIIQRHPEGGAMYAASLNNRATFYQNKGDYEEAEKLYLEALNKFNQSNTDSKLLHAETKSNLAILKSDQGKYDEAIALLMDARNTYEDSEATGTVGYLNVLNKMGSVYLKAGKYTQAKESFDVAYVLSSNSPETTMVASLQSLTGLGSLSFQKGKIIEADSIFKFVIAIYEGQKLRKDANYLAALNNLASVKQLQGQLKVSRDLVRKMSNQTAELYGNESRLYALALNNLAMLDLRLGFVSAAKLSIDSTITIYTNLKATQSTDYALSLATKGRYYQMLGNYNVAEPDFKRALEIVSKNEGPKSPQYAQLLNNQALLLQTLGNYEGAEKLLIECKEIVENRIGKNNVEYSTALQNVAALLQMQNQFARAEKMLEEAQSIDKVILGEMNPQYAVLIQNLATVYQKTGRTKEAEVYLNSALRNYEFNFGRKHGSYATTIGNLASLYQDEYKWEQAEAAWKESLNIRKELVGEEHPDYVRAQLGLAGLYHAQSKLEDAEALYEIVIKNYQKQVKVFFPSMSEKEKAAFFAKVRNAFDSYSDFAFEYSATNSVKRPELLKKVYDLQLINKAILLSSSSNIRAKILGTKDTQILSLYQEWLRTKELILKWYTQYSIEERDQMDIKQLENRANDLEKSLSLQSSFFKEGMDEELITWSEVKKSLSTGEAAVEILRIKKKFEKDTIYYVGLLVNSQSEFPEAVIFPFGNKLESRYYKFLRNSIKFFHKDSISYPVFWKPLEEKLNNVKTVFISCDGVFNKVNFNVLREKNSDQFVIDKWLVRRLSNTRELVEIRKATESVTVSNSALLIGFADFNLEATNISLSDTKRSAAHFFGFEGDEIPVLPATEKEVNLLGQLMTSRQWAVTKLMQAEASEENIKKLQGQSVVHIASHGYFLMDIAQEESSYNQDFLSNPLFQSGILLSGAAVPARAREGKEDGILTAYEAMSLNMDKTELVALSACETGLGEIQNGEGVFGLQRSFLVAGASSILMSLWQVDDVATQELMIKFYSVWLGGEDKHEAFKKAQLEMKDKFKEPYYWGGFIMVGK
ncbi:MAG: tetratricopeptide repeat protein [Bacteroidota bacterium]